MYECKVTKHIGAMQLALTDPEKFSLNAVQKIV